MSPRAAHDILRVPTEKNHGSAPMFYRFFVKTLREVHRVLEWIISS